MARAIRAPRRRLLLGAFALLATALVIAGCGGSGSSSSGGSSGEVQADPGESNAAVAAAQKEVAKYLSPPTSNGITEPLAKKPAPGKLIYSIACGLSPCKVLQKGATEAGEALGWTVKSLVSDGTPENIVEQVEEALGHNADGIMITGFARSSFEPALQKAIAQHVPMVNSGTPDPAKPPFISITIGKPVFKRNAEIMANWIVADSKGDAHVAIFHVSTFPVLDFAGEQLANRIKSTCSSCSVEEINSQITEVGTALPQKVVSTLQQDPSINYVFFTDASFATGVPQALSEAGLSEQVKVTVAQPTEVDLESIREGSTAAATGYPLGWNGWAGIDSFARYFAGENPKPPPLAAPTQILTKETVGSTTDWEPPNYQQEFLKLWHVE